MAIDKLNFDVWCVTCDFCGRDVDFEMSESNTFYDVVQEIKDYGWKVIKSNGVWEHKCGGCQDSAV